MTETDYESVYALSGTLVRDLYARLIIEVSLGVLFIWVGQVWFGVIWMAVIVPCEYLEVMLHYAIKRAERSSIWHPFGQFGVSLLGGGIWCIAGVYLWRVGDPILMVSGASMVVGVLMHATFKYSDWSKGALVGALPPSFSFVMMALWLPVQPGHIGYRALLIFGFVGLLQYTYTIAKANIEKQERLKRAVNIASEASRTKSAFLANMSHEIRTPMNGVIGMADLLGRSDLNKRQREMVEIIQESGDTLLRIIDDVLDLSKIEAGHMKLTAEPFDLNDVIRTIDATSRLVAQEKNLGFSCTVETHGQSHFSGDGLRLRQVIGNLVSNAVKFTSEGEVRLELEARPKAGNVEWLLCVTVTDTGPGLTEAQMRDVFRPFVQADDSLSREHGGTGLGLSIAYDIARAMKGDLLVRSKVGEGSVFTFTCPLVPVAPPALASQEIDEILNTRKSSDAERRPLILVAEDHPVNRRMLEIMLDSLEVDFVFAEDGNAAVEACDKNRFDLVLMDIQMPGLSGVEALQRIHAKEGSEGQNLTPMIALTANAMTHQVKSYLEAGFDGFLAKPFSIEELIIAINKVLFTPAE